MGKNSVTLFRTTEALPNLSNIFWAASIRFTEIQSGFSEAALFAFDEPVRTKEAPAILVTDYVDQCFSSLSICHNVGKFDRSCEICQIVVGSFSAVSKPRSASRYAFSSSCQALQNVCTFV